MADEPMNWHHLFGVLMQDFFRGTPCVVELERDLSIKSQFLDVLIVRKTGEAIDRVLPDGLEGRLAEHNLITFKSHRETLNSWAILELLAHYVNYRKQVSPSFDDLLPEEQFHLFAICARTPEGLAKQTLMNEVLPGVWEIVWGMPIRIIVAGDLPRIEANAMLHLFSAAKELVQYGQQNCRIWSRETSTLIARLFNRYRAEGLKMPYTREEVLREAVENLWRDPPPELLDAGLRTEGLTAEQILQRIPPDVRLRGMTPEQRLEGISPEQRLEGISPEQRLEGLTPGDRERLRKLLDDPPSGGKAT